MLIEQKILTTAAETNPDEVCLERIRRYLSQDTDTRRLVDLAVKEGLGGFLYRTLFKADLLQTLKPEDQQRLYTNYYLTIRRNLKLLHVLNTLLEAFERQGIQVVLMQGISLLQRVYRDVGLRPMNDMDLWVLPQDHARLVGSLIRQGFERDVLYPNTFRKAEAVLDIRTHILWADRIKSRKYLLKTRQEEIFYNSIWVNTDKGRVRCLRGPDQFLYLGLHALKHNFERLIWLADIKHLIRDWNASQWSALAKRAQMLGQEHIVCYVAYLLKSIFKLGIPTGNDDFPAGHRLSFFEETMLRKRVNGSPIPTWSQIIMISTGKSVKARLFFMMETLFPRAEVLRQVFAGSYELSVPRLYWERVLQMFGHRKTGF